MFLQSFLQADVNQRMSEIKDTLKILILKEIKIDYDYFVNEIFKISKKDKIYFDYIKTDYTEHVNKIINDQIEMNLNHFTEIKLLNCMVDYFSKQYKLYLKEIQIESMTIMYKYISDNLKNKIKEFDMLNNNKSDEIDEINNSVVIIINEISNTININVYDDNCDMINNNTVDSINIDMCDMINVKYKNTQKYKNKNTNKFIAQKYKYKNTNKFIIQKYKYNIEFFKNKNNMEIYILGYGIENYIDKFIIKNYKYENKYEDMLKKKSSKYKILEFILLKNTP